ncbi:uncharacterized protein LOC110909350 [Helianthus annuus]|uniref:uncharacterized protein LOC110909350 n=1 Tax=Helianthus annuus TaxID=4232 RepID=UPI000B8F007D|nr:uncharacterized protein LOC110909350 [Helianthus annuus]
MNILSLNIRGLGVQRKAQWVRDIRLQQEVCFLMLQETQYSDYSSIDWGLSWGRGNFRVETVEASGRSGGLVSLWDASVFSVLDVKKSRNCLLVVGSVKGSGVFTYLLKVYAPQTSVGKRLLWAEIKGLVGSGMRMWILAGDFNSVRNRDEWRSSKFSQSAADEFNEFLEYTNLHEYTLKGRRFTFVSGNKMGRIDRVFVNWNFMMEWPNAEYRALGRDKSDHGPLILKVNLLNYGPKPFHFFNSWLDRVNFDGLVRKALEEGVFMGAPDVRLISKFRRLRHVIGEWKVTIFES